MNQNQIDPSLLEPGRRVTVVQQVQLKGWTNRLTGVVEACEQRKTGSWFAHSKDDKLWLDRLVLRLDDGEIVSINLDQYSRVEPAEDAADESISGGPTSDGEAA